MKWSCEVVLLSSLLVARAAAEPVTVPLSNPGEPARLEVAAVIGTVEVVGGSGNNVVVHVSGDSGDTIRADGLRRIPHLPKALDIVEKGNVVTIKARPWSDADGLDIEAPAASSARISTVNDGDVRVRGLTGELDLHNTNGDIEAKDVSGPVSASTVNGDVTVELTADAARGDMAFSTLNGDVIVTLPEGYGANVRLRSQNGDVHSDFDVTVVQSTSAREKSRGPDSHLEGTINGGGAELLLTTFNGDVVLRRAR